MFDLSPWIPLPLIWGGIIAIAILFYSVLDGFDLGVGIMLPWARSEQHKQWMMASIAPFWDGNETWLVLGGGGLLAAFPLAYAIVMPALYAPLILMLLGLVLRGVAFEFRAKSEPKARRIWDAVFSGGSLVATLCQGLMAGRFLQGFSTDGRNFSGSLTENFNAWSLSVAFLLVSVYLLLGSTWLIMKTEGDCETWSRKQAKRALMSVVSMTLIVCITGLWIHNGDIEQERIWLLALACVLGAGCVIHIQRSLRNHQSIAGAFFGTIGIVVAGWVSLLTTLYPWIVPYRYTFDQAAASNTGLSIMLVGVIIIFPVILAYIGYCYYIFRGKVRSQGYEKMSTSKNL